MRQNLTPSQVMNEGRNYKADHRNLKTAIHGLNGYYCSIPLGQLLERIEANGFVARQEDGTPWEGFLCGDSGRAFFPLTWGLGQCPGGVEFQWHRESGDGWTGTFEINCYLTW